MLLKEVRRAIESNNMIKEGDKVIVGVSGGADSVTLLLQLAEYRKETEYTLQVFHLNHMIREEAPADEEFVRALCDRLKIPFFSKSIDVTEYSKENNISVEEAGRILRYEQMRSMGPDKIAVGHHMDDLAETIILNMCRGTGLHGMVGIAPVQDDIIRPLIYLSRTEIEEYLASIDQDYRTDSTNLETEYTRNKIRHEILPLLTEGINEKAVEHIAAMADDMINIENHIMMQVDKAYDEYVRYTDEGVPVLRADAVRELDDHIAKELILKILEKLTPRRKDITRNHVEGILGLLDGSGEKSMDLPYGLRIVRSYDRLIFTKVKESEEAEDQRTLMIKVPGLTEGEGWSTTLENGMSVTIRVRSFRNKPEIPNKTYTKWFDYDKIDCSRLYLRYRKKGDYLTINNGNSKKSVQDYMVDEKIERFKRDRIPMLTQDDHVLWIIGYRISEYYKLTEESRRILEVEITKI